MIKYRWTISAGAIVIVLACVRAEDRPVEQELKKTSEAIKQKAPDATKVFEAGIAEIAASGVLKTAPKVGDKVKMFELPDATGQKVKLADLLARGPVVLTWYRGGWCPYCNIGLRGMLKAEPQIRELGATLVAITPEVPDAATATAKKNELTFAVLSDKGNATARAYGIAFKVPEKTSAMMKAFKIDLTAANGDDSDVLPLGATFVLDRDGVVRWAFVNADYRKRAEPVDVLAALKALKK